MLQCQVARLKAYAADESHALPLRLAAQAGAVSVQTIVMVFVAIVIIYQLIPEIGSSNAVVQASTNASSMAKFAAGLGEWMFPLLGIIAVVFLLFKGKKKDSI